MAEQVLSVDDPQAFLGGLLDAARGRLTPQVAATSLTVVRQKSLADRLIGRDGSISAITLTTRGSVMELTCSPTGTYSAETRRVVRGIIIARRSQQLREWLEAFALRIAALAGEAVDAPDAGAAALQKLGISVSGPTVEVGDDTVMADLRTLPFKLRGSLPPAAAASTARIVELLLDTLPRVSGDLEANAFAERTATVYLPDTLRAYLALPVEWARSHVYPDGGTPDSALAAQLTVLERAVARMHEAAVRGDAEALLVNGRFLNDRFPDASR
ncbi:hypothetical protein B7R22_14735 [Subtercola boreus]|uniref:Uncharacterized protein n=1 Tax=Subtercola boreus TaxID=120213 RepID=A0A3E0VU27_9MICO|nr:hypothetical protein [Subtercola boreus]RFA12898.1 hypothetical protein B7R22_14735 [Subtercola boreus]